MHALLWHTSEQHTDLCTRKRRRCSLSHPFAFVDLWHCGLEKWSYRGLRSKQPECALVFSLLCICFKVCVTITECAYTGFKANSSVKGCVPSLSW